MSEVLTEDRGSARVITINRPERRNALDVETAAAIAEEVTAAAAADVRTVVLTGAPPAFCSGGDLPSLAAVAAKGSLAATDVIYQHFHGIVRAMRDCPLPVIAVINGPAMGAGLDLALCCDLRIAESGARFESSWVKAGLVPGMAGARRLPHVVGSAAAASMLLLGETLDAPRALELGLVNQVVSDGEGMDAALAMTEQVLALPAAAVARTKAALRRSLDHGLEDELATLGAQQGQLLVGPDFQKVAVRLKAPKK